MKERKRKEREKKIFKIHMLSIFIKFWCVPIVLSCVSLYFLGLLCFDFITVIKKGGIHFNI